MEDAIRIENRWYIPATSPRADDRTRVLKSDEGFAVFSRHGDIGRVGMGEQGFYYRGIRHLSEWRLLIGEREPMLLNSFVQLDNTRLAVDQTTLSLHHHDRPAFPEGTLHLQRELAAHGCSLTERLSVVNYHDQRLETVLEYRFDADFCDLFEVRGEQRARRGVQQEARTTEQEVLLGYKGLDGVLRQTRIRFDQPVSGLAAQRARFELALDPGETWMLEAVIACASGEHDDTSFCLQGHRASVEAVDRAVAEARRSRAEVFTDNEQFNDWLNRSAADLQMLTTETRYGLYPYAGVPWFSTPFGRDGLITALQTLWLQPSISAGVLRFLAATQAEHDDPLTEAEPGKIIHEMREGEMATLGEVPFRRYFGTVDATPLYLMLAGRYYHRTGDLALLQALWPSLERAAGWIERQLDENRFLVYSRHGDRGLVQQGWKDSDDSIFDAAGRPAEPPIALCEVQGYAVDALRQAASLALLLGEPRLAQRWREHAEALHERLEEQFWVDALGTYAIALDGHGRPCAVRSSNPAHLLYAGAISGERAARVAAGLVSASAFNGWGLRTLFAGEPRYNPMSYHNGSVWPHDTAIAAAGLARSGFPEAALMLVEGLFNAAIHFDLHRLPELFCGFDRKPGQAPTHYPSACAPQAWASGAVFMLVEAMLGLDFEPERPQVFLHRPRLPDYINWLKVRGLRHAGAEIDLHVHRYGDEIAVNVERRSGDIELIITV
jgi:glycogen debranching enzyme